jgi:sortase A
MRLLEKALLVFGLACLGWYGLVAADAAYTQRVARAALEQLIEKTDAAKPIPPAAPAGEPAPTMDDNLIGLLEIPRLGMSTPIVEGDDKQTLHGAVGHLPDTPRPWERGNSAIAAHRDGLFRPLKDIRIGDQVRVMTPRGEVRYEVTKTRIVKPTDLSVLAATSEQTLTLITCYPFYYVGSAPKRFIVHAERVANEELRTKN